MNWRKGLSHTNLMCSPSASLPSCIVHAILKVKIGLMEIKVGEKGDGKKINAKGPTVPISCARQ